MKKIQKIVLVTLAVLMVLGLTSLVLIPSVNAVTPTVRTIDPGVVPRTITPEAAITTIFNLGFWVLLSISGLFFLYGAYLFLMGGQSEDSASKGKSVLLYAVVGIVLAILARGLAEFIPRMFGIITP